MSERSVATVIAGPITTEHPIETCYGSIAHCFSHDTDEPGDGYRICYECHHLFATPGELLAAHNRQLAKFTDLPPETDAGKVYCCPLCTHDW